MLVGAAVLLGCLVLVAAVLPPRLARARWPLREPVLALLLWQSAGLAGGLLCLTLAVTLALAPVGTTWSEGWARLPQGLPASSWLPALLGVVLLSRLASVLVSSTVRTLRARRHNRQLVDLVAERNPLLRGTSVVDSTRPVAYCLPGGQPRLVLSRGTLSLLTYEELTAVLAHERAHLDQRHDLVVLPFVALGATFPRLAAVRTARAQVALLVELLADDRAARHHDREHLARALHKIGAGSAPGGSLTVAGGDVLLRARRLLEPPDPVPRWSRVAILVLTAAVAVSPTLGPLVPVLVR